MQKDQRTKIHDSVKKAFGKKIIGSTVSTDDKKFIVFTTYSKEGTRILYLDMLQAMCGKPKCFRQSLK
jgi:hypothetical protein